MSELQVTKRATLGDKAVAIGGFLAVLLTGFFGAEPTDTSATQRSAHAMIATACDESAADCALR